MERTNHPPDDENRRYLVCGVIMATATKPRKKYNPVAKKANFLRQLKDSYELRLRTALLGSTVSYNSSFANDAEMNDGLCLSINVGVTKFFTGPPAQKQEAIERVFSSWLFDWSVVLTIYCTDDYGVDYDRVVDAKFEYCSLLTRTDQEITPGMQKGIIEQIEDAVLSKAKNLCNTRHIKEWGYMATITYFE